MLVHSNQSNFFENITLSTKRTLNWKSVSQRSLRGKSFVWHFSKPQRDILFFRKQILKFCLGRHRSRETLINLLLHSPPKKLGRFEKLWKFLLTLKTGYFFQYDAAAKFIQSAVVYWGGKSILLERKRGIILHLNMSEKNWKKSF